MPETEIAFSYKEQLITHGGRSNRGIVFRMIQVQGDINFPEFALPGQEVQFDGRAGSADR